MAYTLIGSIRSPFVRICRMLMESNGIPFVFRVLNIADDAKAAAELAKESPINRVPVLLDGNQKIFDSRVIANFLIKRHGLAALTLDEENLVSAIYSCLDTGVTLFLMRKDGFDMNDPGFFLSRQRARIPANLAYLTPFAEKLDPKRDWNYVSMSLYSFLFWANARELIRLTDYPKLVAFMERFKDAPGVQSTGF
jgi:glutathione S-transferase